MLNQKYQLNIDGLVRSLQGRHSCEDCPRLRSGSGSLPRRDWFPWIPASAGMTGAYSISSFPRTRESRTCYRNLLIFYIKIISD